MKSYHFRVKFGLKIANVFFKLTIQFRLIFNFYWCCCLFHHWLVFVLVVSVWQEGTIKSFQLKYCKRVGNQIIIPILKLKIINKLKYRTHSFCIYCQYNKRFIKLLWLIIFQIMILRQALFMNCRCVWIKFEWNAAWKMIIKLSLWNRALEFSAWYYSFLMDSVEQNG